MWLAAARQPKANKTMTQTFINPNIVIWARERAGLSVDALARKMTIKPERLHEWETGQAPMTLKQMRRLAEKTYTPFGYLFGEEPPEETLPIPDFRTFGDRDPLRARPSATLLDTIYTMQRRQNWFRDYLIEAGAEPLPFVTGHSTRQGIDRTATAIRDFLGTDEDKGIAEHAPGRETAIRDLIESTESNTGILVLRNGVVGNNTHRPLDVAEFRGFALYDEYAPLIFINGKDAKAAQIFTLAHELAHLWIGQEGVSNIDFRTMDEADDTEKFCNAVAAELLAPLAPFLQSWEKEAPAGKQIEQIGKRLNVSNLVIARRALENKLVTRNWYWDFYEAEEKRRKEMPSPAGSGGNFYATYRYRAGRRFARAVIASAMEGKLPYRDAHKLLDIKTTATFNKVAKNLGQM